MTPATFLAQAPDSLQPCGPPEEAGWLSLRITRIRSVDGIVWHIPNGEIRRVGNQSQQWSRALIDVPAPYAADLSGVMALIQSVADGMAADPESADRILTPPEVWGSSASMRTPSPYAP